MNQQTQKTAKIYSLSAYRNGRAAARRLTMMEAEARSYPRVEYGSGWYHDEAIADKSGSDSRH